MDYPTLPTDNLYKFIALAGLAITLFSLVYPAGKTIDLELAVVETKFQSAKYELEVGETERLLAQMEKLNKENLIRADVSTLEDRIQQSKIKSAEVAKLIETLNIQLKWASRYSLLGLVGSVVGIFITFAGFFLWYTRVQRPLDTQIQKGKSSY